MNTDELALSLTGGMYNTMQLVEIIRRASSASMRLVINIAFDRKEVVLPADEKAICDLDDLCKTILEELDK